jgi:hypothetical protein
MDTKKIIIISGLSGTEERLILDTASNIDTNLSKAIDYIKKIENCVKTCNESVEDPKYHSR